MTNPRHTRVYGAYQEMGRAGFGLGGRAEGGVGRGQPVGRAFADVGPGGEAGVQTVPWPWEVEPRLRYEQEVARGYNAIAIPRFTRRKKLIKRRARPMVYIPAQQPLRGRPKCADGYEPAIGEILGKKFWFCRNIR